MSYWLALFSIGILATVRLLGAKRVGLVIGRSANRGNHLLQSSRGAARLAGLVMISLALLAFYAMSTMLKHALMQSDWERTNCTVVSAALRSDGHGTDSLDLMYRYSVQGTDYRGELYELPSNVSRSQTFFRQQLERLVPGVDVECFYNPTDPQEVVLRRTTFGDAAFVIIPAIFLLIGLSILLPGLRKILKRESSRGRLSGEEQGRQDEHSAVRTAAVGRVVFFSLFILAGLGYAWLIFGIPYGALRETRNWNQQRCTIIDCKVIKTTSRTSSSGSSSDYSTLDLQYEYRIADRRYLGKSYSGGAERFIGEDSLAQIAAELSPGTDVECYVDPLDPTRAVLSRNVPLRMFVGLFPLIFSIAGLLGLAATGVNTEKKKSGLFAGPTLSTSRLKVFVTYCLLTIVWNGITATVVSVTAFDSNGSIINMVALLLAIPFLLIGVLLMLSVPWAFLQLFNPTTELELSAERIIAGHPFLVGWRIKGNMRRVRELVIRLEPEWQLKPDDNRGSSSTVRAGECIKPCSFSQSQLAMGGKAEFQIPDQQRLDQFGQGAVLRGWKLSVVMSIPWYPDSLEEHRIEAGEAEGSLV